MIPYEPAFAKEEYASRLEQVRRGMSEQELDALLLFSPENVFYLSGMDSQAQLHYQCLIVPLEGDPTLVHFDFHSAAADNTCWLREWVTFSSFEDPVEVTAAILRRLGLHGKCLGLEQRSRVVTPHTYARLVARLSEAEIRDSFGVVERVRLCKSPAELAYMRQAARLTDLAVEAAYAAMTVGARDGDVAAAIMNTLYHEGSDPISWGPIVASGYRAGVAHSSFNGRTLTSGDTVFLELTGLVRRYVAPVMRTAVLGQPSLQMERLAEAGRDALAALIETARPGLPASEVASAGLAALEPVLDEVVFHHDFGYPVGINYPDSWTETLGYMLRVDNPEPLEVGMTFHLPISLRTYGEFAINQSHTIVITETGAETLTKTVPRLEVLDRVG